MFSRPFRKGGVIYLTTYMGIYKRGGIVRDLVSIVQKEMPPKCYSGKSEVLPSMRLALL